MANTDFGCSHRSTREELLAVLFCVVIRKSSALTDAVLLFTMLVQLEPSRARKCFLCGGQDWCLLVWITLTLQNAFDSAPFPITAQTRTNCSPLHWVPYMRAEGQRLLRYCSTNTGERAVWKFCDELSKEQIAMKFFSVQCTTHEACAD